MSRVIHFEFATPEPNAEAEFFGSLFGWKIEKWGDEQYWLVTTGADEDPGINGAILPQNSPQQPPTVNTIDVDDLDATVEKAVAAGATVAMERMEIPGVGWTAYLVSPTGVMFGIIQEIPQT